MTGRDDAEGPWLDLSSHPGGDPDEVLSPGELASLQRALATVTSTSLDERWHDMLLAAAGPLAVVETGLSPDEYGDDPGSRQHGGSGFRGDDDEHLDLSGGDPPVDDPVEDDGFIEYDTSGDGSSDDAGSGHDDGGW